MRRFQRGGERLAVLDTETTGFSKADRIVEIAVLTVVDGEIVDEFDTLLSKQRPDSPTWCTTSRFASTGLCWRHTTSTLI